MEVGKQNILTFAGVEFVNVNVRLLQQIPEGSKIDLSINISPKVFYPQDNPNNFTIIQDLKLVAESFFEISIIAFGLFSMNEPISGEQKKSFININAPAIMFPYVRAFISTLTANLGAGINPVILPPHFFKGELEEVKPPNPADTL